jgi:hypothetical protein
MWIFFGLEFVLLEAKYLCIGGCERRNISARAEKAEKENMWSGEWLTD